MGSSTSKILYYWGIQPRKSHSSGEFNKEYRILAPVFDITFESHCCWHYICRDIAFGMTLLLVTITFEMINCGDITYGGRSSAYCDRWSLRSQDGHRQFSNPRSPGSLILVASSTSIMNWLLQNTQHQSASTTTHFLDTTVIHTYLAPIVCSWRKKFVRTLFVKVLWRKILVFLIWRRTQFVAFQIRRRKKFVLRKFQMNRKKVLTKIFLPRNQIWRAIFFLTNCWCRRQRFFSCSPRNIFSMSSVFSAPIHSVNHRVLDSVFRRQTFSPRNNSPRKRGTCETKSDESSPNRLWDPGVVLVHDQVVWIRPWRLTVVILVQQVWLSPTEHPQTSKIRGTCTTPHKSLGFVDSLVFSNFLVFENH